MRINLLLGQWPLVFDDREYLRCLYNIYSKLILTIYAIFVVSLYIKVMVPGRSSTTQEITQAFCMILLGAMNLLKVLVIRRPKIIGLIREVFDVEEALYQQKDDGVVKVYDFYLTQTHRSSTIYLVCAALVIITFMVFPLLAPIAIREEVGNTTIILWEIPESGWVPWNAHEHYWVSYSWHIFSGVIAASSVAFMDTFLYSLIIFPLGQIDILKHHLRNFQKYAEDTKHKLNCSADEASFFHMRRCILKHKDIIRYIDDYNGEIKHFMIFDFLISSLQLAAIAVTLVMSKLGFLDMIHWGGFLLCMLMRLLVYYWYANEIMLKSSSVGGAIWESDWFEESQRTQKLMLLMIIRSQRPLGLQIGPFTTMTLERFLGIVKAAYSYVMIMYNQF